MNRTPRAAILLHMLLVWGWAWFWRGEPLSLALWLGPGLCVLSLTLTVKGAWCAFTRTNELRDGRVSQKIEPLETSRKQDSLSSFFCFLVPVLGGISIYNSPHSLGLSPHVS